MVFAPIAAPNTNHNTQISSGSSSRQSKILTRSTLESSLALQPSNIRPNEGEAALHGVYYDDSSYDYMQHMRDLGSGPGSSSTFVPALSHSSATSRAEQKKRQPLEDALREVTLSSSALLHTTSIPPPPLLLDADMLPSQNLKQYTYQSQQNIPDAIAGFQPEMDQRVREALEALEDEAYVDDDDADDDIFADLTQGGEEVSLEEFHVAGLEQSDPMDEDGGWESDNTEKAFPRKSRLMDEHTSAIVRDREQPSEGPGTAWLQEYGKFKSAAAKGEKPIRNPAVDRLGAGNSTMTTSTGMTGRRKKRKGAMTNPSAYSMTSSALCRTEGLTLLDDRFDVIAAQYMDDDYDELEDAASRFDDGVSIAASGMTGLSRASIASRASRASTTSYMSGTNPGGADRQREDFDSIMDDFLGTYSTTGKKKKIVKHVAGQTAPLVKGGSGGLEHLDEIRAELGPARVKVKSAQP